MKDIIIKIMMLSMLLLPGCTLDIPPADQYSDPDAVKDEKTARAYLTGIYIEYPHEQFYMSILGNDFETTPRAKYDVSMLDLHNHVQKEIKSFSENLWQEYYKVVADCMALRERIDLLPSSDELSVVRSEASAIEAMAYFDLLRMYAGNYSESLESAGVVIKTEFGVQTLSLSSIKECTEHISGLLDQASGVREKCSAGWLSQDAVEMMRARLALYKGEYSTSLAVCSRLLDGRQLSPGSLKMWTLGDENVIFAFNNRGAYYTGIEYSKAEGDYFRTSASLRPKNGDARHESYVIDEKFGKYNLANKTGEEIRYIDNIRIQEAVFIAAESLAVMHRDEAALDMLNRYLSVCGCPVGEKLEGSGLVSRIMAEKYKEFAGEGRNFFDLKRRGEYGREVIFPIPQSESKYNPNL